MLISISVTALCIKCDFKSAPFKMYREVQSTKRGQRPSSLNLALGTTLQTLPINSTNFIHLAAGIGMDPPSHNGMTKLMNKCDGINCSLGRESIDQEIEIAKKTKRKTSELNATVDAMYSNPIFSESTPTHAANQAYTTVLNDKNKVLHIGVYNKQCHKGQLLAKKGVTVNCGINGAGHEGHCSANLPHMAPIGREANYVLDAAKTLKMKGADPTSFTKDGDGSVQKALLEFYGDIEILNDEHHLNKSFKKQLRKQVFSDEMFPARTKKIKQVQINNFTEDVASRCYTELKEARKTYKSFSPKLRKEKILNSLKGTQAAIICCLKGDHAKCLTSSFICNPLEGKIWTLKFLSMKTQMVLSNKDHIILEKLLAMRIGPAALEVLWRGTSTQANEAFNRKIRKHLPKSTNFTRNVKGRVLQAAAFQNRGYKTATQILHQRISFKTCGKLQRKLAQEEHLLSYHKKYQKKQTSKNQRFKRKFEKYRYHLSTFVKLDCREEVGVNDAETKYDKKELDKGYRKHADIFKE